MSFKFVILPPPSDYIKEMAAVAAPTSFKVIKAQVYRHLNMELGEAMQEVFAFMES